MRNWFEGHYVKIVDNDKTVAVIFGRAKTKKERKAFIQVITEDNSYNVDLEYGEYSNVSPQGFSFDHGTIKADVVFSPFTPIKYDAMGFFRFFPFMECKHRVVSMFHKATGRVEVDGKVFEFNNADCFIEGDSGKSFPRRYIWTQYGKDDFSVVAMAARIPYLGMRFTGTICIIHAGGREYRLATYRGACVKVWRNDKLVVKQGRKRLEITVPDPDKNMRELHAPQHGKMARIIRESIATTVNYKLTIGNKVLFDITADQAAFEYDSYSSL
ncbi:MAG: hypothetical protein FWE31_00860 [Firmicutes bacterium]|nr:hypothetical protein [Bacillota bacterium]